MPPLKVAPAPTVLPLPTAKLESLVMHVVGAASPNIDVQAEWIIDQILNGDEAHQPTPAARCPDVVAACYRLLSVDYPRVGLRALQLLLGQLPNNEAERLQQRDPRVAELLAIGPEIDSAVADLLGEADWKLAGTYKNLQGKAWAHSYARKRGNGRLDVKVQGTMRRRLRHVCSTLLHVDMLCKWIPGICKSVEIVKVTNFRRCCYLRLNLPWPLANRDVFVVGYGDIYDESSCIVYLRSCRDDEFVEERREWEEKSVKDGCVRMEMSGGFMLQALSPNVSRITQSIAFDLKMKALSPALQDFLMKTFAAYFLPMMSKQASYFEEKGKHAALPGQPANASLYEELDRRLAAVVLPGGTSAEIITAE